MRNVILAAVAALVVGLLIGFFAGRWMLERSWRQPQLLLTPDDEKRLAADDADPVPPAGTKILRPMPLQRSRDAHRELVKNDPLRSRVAAVGNGEDGAELHVDVINNGKCTVTSLNGVAFAFDAWGEPAMANKHGENYVAFSADKIEIEPGGHYLVAQKLRYPETASLAIAQIDAYACKDGPPWKRQ